MAGSANGALRNPFEKNHSLVLAATGRFFFVNRARRAASQGTNMKTMLVSLALATAAVSTAQAEHYRPSVVRDTTIVGAVAGALIGGHNGNRWAEGAIVGAAAGAVVGAVVDSNRSSHVEYRHRHVRPAPVVVVNPAPVVVVNRAPRRVVYVDAYPPPVVVSRPVVVIDSHRHGHRHHHRHRHHHHRY